MKAINLSIGYTKKVVATGINLQLEAGKLSCLIGENGVGKSTLLRTLAGFQKPLEGTLLIDGTNINDIPKQERAKKIAVVLTDKLDIQNTSVRELVAMGRMPYTGFFGKLTQEDEKIVNECMSITSVEPTRKIHTLSDGERQKVMIARALAQQTPYIFLDEPTAFLDYPSKVHTMQMLKSLASQYNKTILLSTHDLEISLDMADRLLMMEKKDGKVSITAGKPKTRYHEEIPNFTADCLLAEC